MVQNIDTQTQRHFCIKQWCYMNAGHIPPLKRTKEKKSFLESYAKIFLKDEAQFHPNYM